MPLLCYSIIVLADENAVAASSQPPPDIEVTDVVISGLSRDRQGSYVLESKTMRRYPAKAADELIEPIVEQKRSSGGTRNISADFAEYLRESRTITFYGNVVMKEYGANTTQLTTSRLKTLTIQLDEWE